MELRKTRTKASTVFYGASHQTIDILAAGSWTLVFLSLLLSSTMDTNHQNLSSKIFAIKQFCSTYCIAWINPVFIPKRKSSTDDKEDGNMDKINFQSSEKKQMITMNPAPTSLFSLLSKYLFLFR